MYRYVFKRVKETFEFGVNARKSYACQQASSIKYQNQNEKFQQHHRQVANFQEINFLTPIEHQKKRYEDFKRKYNFKHPNNCNPFLHAITWSTALVAGFYASQLLCLYRRNHRLDPKKCFYSKYLDHKNRFIQRKLSYCYHAKQQQQQKRSFVSRSKPICPLQKLLARRKSPQAAAASSKSQNDEKKVVEEDGLYGLRHDFATFGLFDQRFDKFYDNFGDTSTYKRVYVNVSNLSNDSTETLVEAKDSSSNSSNKSTGNSSVSTQSYDDEEEAIDEILSNLTSMVSEMEFQLGIDCIMHGHYDEAVHHFRMAAGSNHASSLFNLALLYEQGLGVKKDIATAYKLYKSAGELGHDMALFNQGIFHAKGLGGAKKSFRMAKRFFEKSAALGNSHAMEALSMLLPDYHKYLSQDPIDFIVADDYSKSSSSSFERAENQYRSNIRSIAIN